MTGTAERVGGLNEAGHGWANAITLRDAGELPQAPCISQLIQQESNAEIYLGDFLLAGDLGETSFLACLELSLPKGWQGK